MARSRAAASMALSGLLFSACASGRVEPLGTATPRHAATPSEPAIPLPLVQAAIQRMIAPELEGAPLRVLAVAGPARGWLAVAVSPPYREFPTVVLFQSAQDGSWNRVFEALTPGVQSQRSSFLDLHTRGQAVDFTIGDGSRLTPDVIAKILSISRHQQLAIVAHAYFYHGHRAGSESYFVDRTAAYALARRLFPGEYEKYSRTDCTMFDVPALRHIDLRSTGERWLVTAQTENGQTWVVGWNGVDDQGLLTGKTVDAK